MKPTQTLLVFSTLSLFGMAGITAADPLAQPNQKSLVATPQTKGMALQHNKATSDDDTPDKPSSPLDDHQDTFDNINAAVEAGDTSQHGTTVTPNPITPAPQGPGCYVFGQNYTYSSSVDAKWKPWHNTNNFYYVAQPSKDYYQHKRKTNRKVETKCKRGEGNRKKTYINDWWPNNKDSCRETRPGCPSGYSSWKKHAGSTGRPQCVKKIPPLSQPLVSVGEVSAKWKPIDNTKNYHRVIKPGKDHFKHNSRNRTRPTQCKAGSYKTDYHANGKDACVAQSVCGKNAQYLN